MQHVILLVPAVINGQARYPIEGPILVTPEKAADLIESKQAEPVDFEEEAEDLHALKVDELKSLALAEEIDLGKLKAKADIIACIETVRTFRAGGDEDGLDTLEVDQLKQVAAAAQIGLGEATDKATIIAAMRKHRDADAK